MTKKEPDIADLFHEMHKMKEEILHQGKIQKDLMEVLEGLNISVAHLALSKITSDPTKEAPQEQINTLMRIINRPLKKPNR